MNRYAIDDFIGRYRVESLLGAGGMGAVYRAYDPTLERIVALKVIRFDRAGSQRALELFHREANACARLEHPGIVTIAVPPSR